MIRTLYGILLALVLLMSTASCTFDVGVGRPPTLAPGATADSVATLDRAVRETLMAPKPAPTTCPDVEATVQAAVAATVAAIPTPAEPTATTSAEPWEWTSAEPMTVARDGHTATLLPDGRVLLLAGHTDEARRLCTTSAEIYDPATGMYSPIASLNTARAGHTATLLPDGRILVLQGYDERWLTDAEIYDPAYEQWSISQPIFAHGNDHTATLLQDGRVLAIAGGTGSQTPLDDRVEIFDPATNRWQAAAPHSNTCCYHAALLLTDGRVLVAGGAERAEPVIYDPASDAWQRAGSPVARRGQAAIVKLQDGRVLLIGGFDPVPSGGVTAPVLNSVEIYDPATNAWELAAPMAEPRFSHTATLLPDGRVLVIGGAKERPNPHWDGVVLNSVEIYDPATNTWNNLPALREARVLHTATLLPDGRVFVAGGRTSQYGILASTEIMSLGSD